MLSFSVSWLLFWIKGHAQIDSQSIRLRMPRLLIWLIPYSRIAKDINLEDIKDTKVKGKSLLMPIIIGLILLVLGILSIFSKDGLELGILGIIVGLIIEMSGFKARLTIAISNETYHLDVPVSQKKVLFAIKKDIDQEKSAKKVVLKENQTLEDL